MSKIIKSRKTFAIERPDLIEEWYEASSEEETHCTVTAGSDKIVIWCRIECNHIWNAQVKE